MAARGMPATLGRAWAALEAGDLGKATELFGKVLGNPSADPRSFAAAAYGLARCLHTKGDVSRAERLYALAAGASDDRRRQWNCCMALCHLAVDRGDLSEAIRYGALARACCPEGDTHKRVVTLETLASLQCDAGEYTEALDHLAEALKAETVEPSDRGYLLYLRGRALLGLQREEEAATALVEASGLLPPEEAALARGLLAEMGRLPH